MLKLLIFAFLLVPSLAQAQATISDFAISSSGVITTTSSAPTDITTPQTVTITVTATNASGTSPTGTATLTVASSSCSQGASFPDGCPGSPPGTAEFPTILNGYAARPPWNVAGVDFHVGINRSTYPTNASLKDPRVGGNLPAGATYSSGIVTITANNVTLDGFDFSLDGVGMGINVGDGTSNFPSGAVISNSNFKVQSNSAKTPVHITAHGSPWTSWSSNVTITGCEFDGGAMSGFTNASQDMIFWQGTGTFTVEYSIFHNFSWHGIDFQSNNTTTTPIVKYNLFYEYGYNSGHPNSWYFESNSSGLSNAFSNGHFDFNVLYEPASPASMGADSALAIFATEASYVTIANTTGNNSVVISLSTPTSGFGPIFSGNAISGNSTNNEIGNNYYDPTTATTVWAVNGSFPYGATFTSPGNINMVTGAAAPAHPSP